MGSTYDCIDRFWTGGRGEGREQCFCVTHSTFWERVLLVIHQWRSTHGDNPPTCTLVQPHLLYIHNRIHCVQGLEQLSWYSCYRKMFHACWLLNTMGDSMKIMPLIQCSGSNVMMHLTASVTAFTAHSLEALSTMRALTSFPVIMVHHCSPRHPFYHQSQCAPHRLEEQGCLQAQICVSCWWLMQSGERRRGWGEGGVPMGLGSVLCC